MKSDPMTSRNLLEKDWGAEWISLSLVVFFSGCIFVYAHFPAFSCPYVINDDVRQQIYWMQEWQDRELYPNDWLTGYARHYVPWGVQAVYRVGALFLDPLFFSKVLPGILFVFLAACLYRIGVFMAGRQLGWITAAVFWLMPFFMDNLAGGLSRSFAAPLLTLFLYSWLIQKPSLIGLALLLQALFIPYIFFLAVTAVLLAYGGGLIDRTKAPPFPEKPSHFLLILFSGTLVVLWYWSLNAAGYGPLVSYPEMLGRPEFTELGRYPILPIPSFFWELFGDPFQLILYFVEGKIVAGILACTLLAGSAYYGAKRAAWGTFRNRLQPFAYVAAASLLLHLLARILLLQLFIPSRYLTYTVNLFYCFAIAACIHGVFQKRVIPGKLLVCVFLFVVVLAGIRLRGIGLHDYSADSPLYAALENTPKDALIAGHPALMDNVLTFARRPVLASFELSHPWSVGFWARLEPRLQGFFSAYYADQAESVRAFAGEYGVQFLIVDDRHFQPAFLNGHPYFAPFDEMIRAHVKDRVKFAVLSEDVFPATRVTDHLRLLDLRSSRHDPAKADPRTEKADYGE